jgi:hypothetical protein
MALSNAVSLRHLAQTLNPLTKSRRLFNPLRPLSFLSQTAHAARHKVVRIASYPRHHHHLHARHHHPHPITTYATPELLKAEANSPLLSVRSRIDARD